MLNQYQKDFEIIYTEIEARAGNLPICCPTCNEYVFKRKCDCGYDLYNENDTTFSKIYQRLNTSVDKLYKPFDVSLYTEREGMRTIQLINGVLVYNVENNSFTKKLSDKALEFLS